MKMSLRQYCIEHGRDTLLREWDAARNGGLTPSDVSFGSHQKVWWQCSKGHSWQAKVYYPLRNSTLDYELQKLLKENGINTDGKKKGAHTLRSSLASSLLKEGIH